LAAAKARAKNEESLLFRNFSGTRTGFRREIVVPGELAPRVRAGMLWRMTPGTARTLRVIIGAGA